MSNKGLRKVGNDCERLRKLRPGGFEPPTDGLEIRCSIQLSYGREWVLIFSVSSLSNGVSPSGDVERHPLG